MQNLLTKTQEIKVENALYIIATPIGNLGDITLRALSILQKVDLVICEDTRVSSRLFDAYDIKAKKLLTYNDHNDEKTRKKILQSLLEGKSLALISDAGTPLVSDPGYKLITFLKSFNQKIIPLPGASSVTVAVCASGLACDNFLFIGFLPTSKIQKANLLKSLPKNFTAIFFEAPNRVLETLHSVQENLGERRICVARELTKMHEEIITDEVGKVVEFFSQNEEKLRGEFVILLEKAAKDEKSYEQDDLESEILVAIKAGESLKDLSQSLAEIYKINRKEVYQLALNLSKNDQKTNL
jgi:16S rRNA (cytidine1402-2'-O)-methyltransferase